MITTERKEKLSRMLKKIARRLFMPVNKKWYVFRVYEEKYAVGDFVRRNVNLGEEVAGLREQV